MSCDDEHLKGAKISHIWKRNPNKNTGGFEDSTSKTPVVINITFNGCKLKVFHFKITLRQHLVDNL